MIQRSPDEHRKTVVRLAKNLDSLSSPAARASIIWLVGEFSGTDTDTNIAADVLRILVRGYADETDEVRAQIVLLAAKVYLHDLNAKNVKTKALDALKSPTEEKQPESQVLSPPLEEGGFEEHRPEEQDSSAQLPPQEDTITLLYQHTMLLARYTPSYDLRDRARVYRALLALPTSTELASLLLLAPKPVPQAPSPSESHKGYTLGSASLVVGNAAGVNGLRGYEPIPDWVAEGDEPSAKLRDAYGVKEEPYQPQKTVSAGQMLDDALEADPGYKANGRKAKTLDDWLDDEDDDDEEEESESESGSGSEESEEESEYETDEDAESEEEKTESEDDEKAGLVR
jgi:hypothetical protein